MNERPALAIGTVFHEYRVTRYLGEGLAGVQVRHLEDLPMQAFAEVARDAVLMKYAAYRERQMFTHRPTRSSSPPQRR
jgi:hypothetical protein